LKFLTVGAVKRHILHQCTKFRKDRSNRGGDIAFFCDFQDGGCRYLEFSEIQNFNGRSAVVCVIVPNFIKIGRTVAKIWRLNGFQNGGRAPSWICEIRIF